ncbi:glycosyltransferase [Candidatus Parcubacteria bacterium]|nr:glycosyltransferase [Patescibacteria group bacterium]MBU4381176.1 glycosyltransferase [Patescibacteria group bacterium]MCG2689429.1 glycosyltransferase [Candidatus Parcubacteria bacterium]
MKNKKEEPLVSLVMPVFNTDKRFLIEALESCLNQTYQNIETIIVDDGSSNKDTLDVLSLYEKKEKTRVRVLHHKTNGGVSKALNTGIDNSTGEYIAISGSDDIPEPNWIALQLEYLRKNRLSACGCLLRKIDSNGKVFGEYLFPLTNRKIIKTATVRTPLSAFALLTREMALDLEFNESLSGSVDYDFWARAIISKKYRLGNVPKFLFSYRYHNDNLCRSNKTNKKVALCSLQVKRLLFKNGYWSFAGIFVYAKILAWTLLPKPARSASLKLLRFFGLRYFG